MDKNELNRLRTLAGTYAATKSEDNSKKNMYQIRDTLMEAKWPMKADQTPNFDPENNATVANSPHNDHVFRIADLRTEFRKLTGQRAPRDLELEDYEEMVAQARAAVGESEENFEESTDTAMNGNDYVMASPAGSKDVWLWKNVDGKATPVKKYLTTVDAGKLNSQGVKHVRYGAQKYFNDLGPKTEQQQMREWSNSIYKQYDDRGHYQEQPEGETVDLSLRRYLNAKPMKVQVEEDHTVKGMIKEYKGFKNGK